MTSYHCEILPPLAGKRMTKFLPCHTKGTGTVANYSILGDSQDLSSAISPEVRLPFSKMSVRLWMFLWHKSHQRPDISSNYNFFSFTEIGSCNFSITLSDLGVLSNLIGWLSLAN